MKALKYIRIVLAALMLLGITALLLDTTGVLRHWLGWMPKIQLLPAILALNVAVVVAILAVTALIGRFYCAVVCPMGIFQDIFVWFHKLFFGKKRPYRYSKPANKLRYPLLVLFVLAMVVGMNSIAVLIAPYSAYARMVTGLHATGVAQWVAIITLVVIGLMSFTMGRMWCNTICPMGTLLGLISRHSLFGIKIDADKCVGCHKCEHRCKSMCIDIDGGKTVDSSRCVNCFTCIGECKQGAVTFGPKGREAKSQSVDGSRRKFVAGTVAVGAAMAVQAQDKKVDGGLAALTDKQVPLRKTPLKPAEALRRQEPQELQHTLHRLPALREPVPGKGAAPVDQAGEPDAARDELPRRLLPHGLHTLQRGVSGGSHTARDERGEDSHQHRRGRGAERQLHRLWHL